jgi:C1A family cysteine protease
MNYGAVGRAIAADDAFENNPAGTVFKGSGSTDINHEVILVGRDDKTSGWILRNSWAPPGARMDYSDCLWCEPGRHRSGPGR